MNGLKGNLQKKVHGFFDKVHPAVKVITAISFFIILPFFIGPYWTHVLGYIALYTLLGIGLNIVVGFAGLLDLGYVAFFAVGAYTYALLASPHFGYHYSFWMLLPVCLVLGAITGVLLGIPVLRMRGDYLAIVTLGFGEIIRILINNMDSITNGPKGIWQIDPPQLFSYKLIRPIEYYYLILFFCIISFFILDRLSNSRIGRAWMAMREDEDAAQAMGIDILKYKLLAFGTGAAFAGIGGIIFAARQGSIFPADFTLMVSINVLLIVILGGMGSISGIVLGSFVLVGLPEVLRALRDYRLLIFGALLIILMIFRPEGFIRAKRRRLFTKI